MGTRKRRTRPEGLLSDAGHQAGVEVVFSSSGLATVRVDGAARQTRSTRRELAGVLAAIADGVGEPRRLRIVESDGRVYEDLLVSRETARVASPPAESESDGCPAAGGDGTASAAPLVEFHGAGFVPGEDVVVAVVVRQGSAGQDGVARALVDESKAPRGAADVLLFGYVSGTVVTGSGLS